MKFFIATLILNMTFSAFAGPKFSICKKPIEKFLKAQKLQPNWVAVPPNVANSKRYVAPTNKVAKWIEVQVSPKQTILNVHTHNKIVQINFDKKCKASQTKMAKADPRGWNKNSIFRDTDLKKIISAKKSALIYVWSPRQVYSMNYFSLFKKTAKKAKFDFIPLVSSGTPSRSLSSARQKGRSYIKAKALRSTELEMRQGNMHAPTSFFIYQGKLHPNPIVGAKSEEDLKVALAKRILDLEK